MQHTVWPRSIAPRTPAPAQATAGLYLHRRHSSTQRQVRLSLCGVSGSWCTQGLFEPSESLCWVLGLILSAVLPVLQSCWGFFALGHGVSFLVGSNILLLTVIQQQVVILEFFQEKLSACPSTLPSWRKCWEWRRLYMCGHREYMGDIHTFLTILLWINLL